MRHDTSTTAARASDAAGDGGAVVTPTERPASNVIDFLARVPTFLRRPWTADGVDRLALALRAVDSEEADTGWGLSGRRLAAFEACWQDETSVLRQCKWSDEEIDSHEVTAMVMWMHADETYAAEYLCSGCEHSTHAEGCRAIRQLDDGPRICGCEEDNA